MVEFGRSFGNNSWAMQVRGSYYVGTLSTGLLSRILRSWGIPYSTKNNKIFDSFYACR
jgi:hypothetical protein